MKRALIIVAALWAVTMAGFAEEEKGKEEKVTISDLPAAVTNAIKAAYPEGTIKEAEKETENGKTVYEVEVVAGENEYELEITADGKILKKAGEEDDEEDDDDGDDD